MLYRFQQSCSWFNEVKSVTDLLSSESNNRRKQRKKMVQCSLDFQLIFVLDVFLV